MIGYKAKTGVSKGNSIFDFEVGKTYKHTKGAMQRTKRIFHFCLKLSHLNHNFPFNDESTQIFEIEFDGNYHSIGINCFTDNIKILREIPRSEWESISNGEVKFDKNGRLTLVKGPFLEYEVYNYDERGNLIYEEKKFKSVIYKYDEKGNLIYYENSNGNWEKKEYDEKGNLILEETQYGWIERGYDEENNCVLYKDSNGHYERIIVS